MRIGILTFHCAYNVGAMLQCYALQQHLMSLGHEVRIINFRPSYLETKRPSIRLRRLLLNPFNYGAYILKKLSFLRKRYYKFKEFENNYYFLTSVCKSKSDVENLVNNFDTIIWGSDQIWCPKFNGKDILWYGELKKPKSTRFVTYAASAGGAEFDVLELEQFKRYLSNFNAISVREKKLYDTLSPYADIYLTIDPTLLLDASLYEKWYKPIRKDKYVLVRQARPDNNIYRIANIIARELDAQVVTADAHRESFRNCKNVMACSPDEFVSLVKNAQCVVTNSFHGLAFAIITEVPFYTIKLDDGGDERLVILLDSLGLSDRMINKNEAPHFAAVDYSTIHDRLEILRTQSKQYLNNHL